MSEIRQALSLDDKGRCCGRKPIRYKRTSHFFCDRCCRAFGMASGHQIPNWAWQAAEFGFLPTYPDSDYVQSREVSQ